MPCSHSGGRRISSRWNRTEWYSRVICVVSSDENTKFIVNRSTRRKGWLIFLQDASLQP